MVKGSQYYTHGKKIDRYLANQLDLPEMYLKYLPLYCIRE